MTTTSTHDDGQRGGPREPLGFGWRLGAALGLVVLAGAVTLLVVALLVAPPVFQEHLGLVLTEPIAPQVQAHVDEAFATAMLVSLGIAVPVALLTALTVTVVVARRLSRSVATLAAAAEHIADGHLDTRVRAPEIGPEFTQLASAFNAMADRLAQTETTRQRLIGDLAHELRTPLASLTATVDAVADGVLPADAATMSTLRAQTGRLSRLVGDLSAVSRAEERLFALHLGPEDLGEMAVRAVDTHRARLAADGVALELDVRPGTPSVLADADRLDEALGNLLDNAGQHCSPGGTVRVRVAPRDGEAELQVVDDGTGFDPADTERIFERFYRGDASRTGDGTHSGVGLTIARAIVTAHGGTLTAASRGAGTGATFTVLLPVDAHA
ncbi:MAG TPA: HAMP domain-containing sensor histidine kinase [Actinotalea sp.]|nr:HAMP domain-containing sensor histidine kinase [Actinotalea sp.]